MNTLRTRSPLKFFLLVFALSIPFWLAGASTALQLLPGLPVSSLMFICPVTAALILVYRENKTAGVTELLKRSFDFKRIRAKIWYAPIILLMPGVMVLSYGLMRLMGVPLPSPQFTVLAALAMFLAFFIPALGEELGGPDTSSTRCKIGGSRSRPAFSWGWYGPPGTSYRCCRLTDRRHGSPGNASSRWRHGSLSSGSITTRARASSPRRCSTPCKRQLLPVSDLRFILRSAYLRPDHHVRGRTRHSRMGATNVGSVRRFLVHRHS